MRRGYKTFFFGDSSKSSGNCSSNSSSCIRSIAVEVVSIVVVAGLEVVRTKVVVRVIVLQVLPAKLSMVARELVIAQVYICLLISMQTIQYFYFDSIIYFPIPVYRDIFTAHKYTYCSHTFFFLSFCN